jgi:hypothetical protein
VTPSPDPNMVPRVILGRGFNPMWGIPDQQPLRGGIGVSFTMVSLEGQADATASIADQIFESYRARPVSRAHLAANDALQPARLGEGVLNACASLEQLGQINPEVASVHARYLFLRKLGAGHLNGAECREILDRATAMVDERVEELRQALKRSFDDHPAGTAGAVAQVRAAQAEFKPARPNPKLLDRVNELLQKLAEIPSHEGDLTKEAYDRVHIGLIQEAASYAKQATEDVLAVLAWEEFQRRLPSIRANLAETESQSLRYTRRLDEVRRYLAEVQQSVRDEVAKLTSSIALVIAGPSQDEVLTGIKTALQADDMGMVASALSKEFEGRLRDLARARYPHIDVAHSSVATLIVEGVGEDLAQLLADLVEESLGHGHSLFQLIERYGVAAAARFLWLRAESTCFFSGRDHDRLGTPSTEIGIVRLPKATSPMDETIRERLAAAFRSLSQNCQVTGGGPALGINVVRIKAGFPIGTEQSVHSLLPRYALAGREGHRPHLLDLVPDAPLGEASPAYLDLASIFETNYPKYKDE